MYVENPKIEFCMNFDGRSLIIIALSIKNSHFLNIHFCMLRNSLNIQKCMLINIHFCMLFLFGGCYPAARNILSQRHFKAW
jgi:hypothetical protein